MELLVLNETVGICYNFTITNSDIRTYQRDIGMLRYGAFLVHQKITKTHN